jgi:hypothetical protein
VRELPRERAAALVSAKKDRNFSFFFPMQHFEENVTLGRGFPCAKNVAAKGNFGKKGGGISMAKCVIVYPRRDGLAEAKNEFFVRPPPRAH